MLYFAIPLRSKAASKEWADVEELFNFTLASLLNQVEDEYKVIVCCHDIPKLSKKNSERKEKVEFLQVEYPTPNSLSEQMMDKYYKKAFLMKRIREHGGGFVMFVDADDLISNKVSAFVKDNKQEYGWIVDKGYIYDHNFKRIKEQNDFHKVCGTSCILRYDIIDLPEKVMFNGYNTREYDEFIFSSPHDMMATEYENSKKVRVRTMPFRSVIYVINNGENHSKDNRTLKSSLIINMKRILNKNEWKKKVNQNMIDEFLLFNKENI